jgi:hypothetical protein
LARGSALLQDSALVRDFAVAAQATGRLPVFFAPFPRSFPFMRTMGQRFLALLHLYFLSRFTSQIWNILCFTNPEFLGRTGDPASGEGEKQG